MRSIPLFDALAPEYERHFEAPHRRAYDLLAWERVVPILPRPPGLVVDAGCGIGRWAARLVAMGHRVIGIEESPVMARRARGLGLGDRFKVIEGSMEDVELPSATADALVAIGSLQYTTDPDRTLRRLAGWTRPGGVVCVLVDSRLALVLELLRRGRGEEAAERLRTRRGVWSQADHQAEHHLLDRASLEKAFRSAGLADVRAYGLLVSATTMGIERFAELMEREPEATMARERALADDPLLADVGKQLLVTGRRA